MEKNIFCSGNLWFIEIQVLFTGKQSLTTYVPHGVIPFRLIPFCLIPFCLIPFCLIPFRLTKSANVPFRLKRKKFFRRLWGVAWRGLKGEAPAFHNRGQFLKYFQDNWIEGNYPLHMWNMYSLDGPHTNNNAEGWHSKIHKLACKAEQTATEVSLIQLADGWLPVRRRRKCQRHEKRILTVKEKYEVGDYTLSELVQAFSNWVLF